MILEEEEAVGLEGRYTFTNVRNSTGGSEEDAHPHRAVLCSATVVIDEAEYPRPVVEAEQSCRFGWPGAARVISGAKKCIQWSPSPSLAFSSSTSVTSLAQFIPVDTATVVTTHLSQGKP